MASLGQFIPLDASGESPTSHAPKHVNWHQIRNIVESIMSGFLYRPEILKGVADHITGDLKQYEDWFTLETSMLKEITHHFVKELDKGLTEEGGNIVS
jgi:hypothetical protein